MRRSSVLLAATLLACTPTRLSHELASFQRELDAELADVLVPQASLGLDAACHRGAIVWMHFLADGDAWRLLSVDDRGQVGIWTERGLEQTWSLQEHELAWVRDVAMREQLSEDATWLRMRATLAGSDCRSPFCRPETLANIAPRDDRRWIGVDQPDETLAASGDWYALGGRAGNLEVAPIDEGRYYPSWAAPGCEGPSIGSERLELLPALRGLDRIRSQDQFWLQDGPWSRYWPIEPALLLAAPELLWRPVHATRSTNERWLAVAGDAGWLIQDRNADTIRRVTDHGDAPGVALAISNLGTLATAHWKDTHGFVILHPLDGEAITHPLAAAPVRLAFVPGEADRDDTLWISIASEWETFAPLDTRLLRLDPGGVPEPHPVAGLAHPTRALGRLPATLPTLIVTDGEVLAIERLTDGAVLRIVVRDRWNADDDETLAGLSLIWLDAAGRRQCRFDGSNDDHVPTREPRIADAGALVDAFLSDRECQ
jgi:hypothetical protein